MPEDKSYIDQFGDLVRGQREAIGRIPEDVKSYWNNLPESTRDWDSALVGGPNYVFDQAARIATRGNYGWPDVAETFGGSSKAAQESIDRFKGAYGGALQASGDIGAFTGEGGRGGAKASPKAAWMASDPVREAFASAAMEAGGRRNIIIGPVGVENLFRSGRTAPKEAYKIADELAAAGKGREEIWNKTADYFRKNDPEFAGVHYGPDGIPRVELSDANVPWTGSTQDNLQHYSVDLTSPPAAWPHSTLYQAYPEMKDSKLVVLNPPNETENFASFDPRKKSFALNLNKEHKPDSMMAHEAQHYGQVTDNTLGGSNKTEWTPNTSRVEKVLTGQGGNPELVADVMEAARDKYKFDGHTLNDLKKWSAERDLSIEDLANNLSSYIGREKYRRTYGESEARNTQLRYHMSPEQRRENPPYKTFDYPENKLITEY